jgi:hypothetical protein
MLHTPVAAIGCGFIMLVKPKWWVMKYMNTGEGETDEVPQALIEKMVRIISLPVFGIGAYFLYLCIAGR